MRTIDVSGWKWKELTSAGLMGILLELGDARPVETVEIDLGLLRDSSLDFDSFGSLGSPWWSEDAALLSDGRVYAVVTFSVFRGTNQSNESRVRHLMFSKE